ncbi:hypothetical protein D3C80_1025830 [compost metagenome]
MEPEVVEEFGVSPTLVNRFNAWRQITLGLPPAPQPLTSEQTERYQPLPATTSLEQALREQMDWITAWRIDRYAYASLKQAPFYRQASDTEATPAARQRAQAERDAKQAEVEKHRLEQLANERNGRTAKKPLKPGVKDYDPDMAQTQLREAAEEFGKIYRDLDSDPYMAAVRRASWVSFPARVTYMNSADTRAERERMKAAGQARVGRLFPPPVQQQNYVSEDNRGNVDESRNATQPEGLLRALFDDQVHDSRAWFLHAFLNDTYLNVQVAAGREPWGSYFNERMVFFGDTDRRALVLHRESEGTMLAGTTRVPGAAPATAAQPPLMGAEQLAEAMRAMDADWEAYYAKFAEVNDGQA